MFVLGDGCTKRSYYKGGKFSHIKLGEGLETGSGYSVVYKGNSIEIQPKKIPKNKKAEPEYLIIAKKIGFFLHKPVSVRIVPCAEVIMLFLEEGAVEVELDGESAVASRGMGDYAGNGNFVHWLTAADFGVDVLKCWHENYINKGDIRDYEYSISVEITKEEIPFEIKHLVPCESVSMKLLHGAKGVREIGI